MIDGTFFGPQFTDWTRDRVAGEIIPVRAEQSRTADSHAQYGAANAIDLNLISQAGTKKGPDGTVWLKVILDRVHCVEKVVMTWTWYRRQYDYPVDTWSCTTLNCNTCQGNGCYDYSTKTFTVTVDVEGQEVDHDLPTAPDCKLGNTVKVVENYKDWSSGSFLTFDLVVIGKEGKVFRHIQYGVISVLFRNQMWHYNTRFNR